jgi:serine/threonine protein phosphatase PrpC
VEEDFGVAAGISDIGRRHHRNEDAMAIRQTVDANGGAVTIGVVCDGVSTAVRPEEASQAAARAGADTLAAAVRAGTHPEAATHAAIASAVAEVAKLGKSGRAGDSPACTYVSAMVASDVVSVGWIGDSRAYWLAADESAVLTVDDSWAEEMVARGILSAAEARANPRAHALTAWLGADAGDIEGRAVTFTPTSPGVVLVCSDGLWNYLPEAAALTDLALPDALVAPLRAARTLVQYALEAGGHDNTTVVLLPYPPGS